MPKDRVWKNCPSCGTENSMVYKSNVTETYTSKRGEFEPFQVTGLDGYFCKVCDDGIFTIKSSNKIEAAMTHHFAPMNAKKTLFCDLTTVEEMAEVLGISRQRISYMLKNGMISYAILDNGFKLPLRSEIGRIKEERERRKRQRAKKKKPVVT